MSWLYEYTRHVYLKKAARGSRNVEIYSNAVSPGVPTVAVSLGVLEPRYTLSSRTLLIQPIMWLLTAGMTSRACLHENLLPLFCIAYHTNLPSQPHYR